MGLQKIVTVNISKGTATVSKQGFGVVLIVGDNPTFSERYKVYSSDDLTGLATDLTGGSGDPEYDCAVALVSQNPRPPTFAVGRIDVGDADLTATLNAIYQENQDFYGVVITSRTQADQLLGAAWALANQRIFYTADDDANIKLGVGGTLPVQLVTNDKAVVVYSDDADGSGTDKRIDAAIAGRLAALIPGSYTAKFLQLSGVDLSVITPSELTNIIGQNANVFHEVAGVNIFREGVTTESTFIDIMIGIDWLEARITEEVYSLLVNATGKVPYTESGITSIEDAVRKILKIGQDNGLISPDAFDSNKNRIGGFETSVPALADIPSVDKSNRILNNVKFTAYLAGAIHEVVVTGTVVL